MSTSIRAPGLRASSRLVLIALCSLPFAVAGCSGSNSATAAKMGGRSPFGAESPTPNGGYDQLQQEQYHAIHENEFLAVANYPLSTFSTDVNTASYSNVRRFLNQGKLPPKDAVFLAEMINYFPYSYPQPISDDPVSLTSDIAACPWNDKHKLVRIGVKANRIDTENAPPRNLVFLIDTSGSMAEPTRLPLVKKSLALLIDRLRPNDVVSVVTYAGDAMLTLGPTPGSRKARIRGVVEALDATGSTNGGGGIRMAYDQARLNFIQGGSTASSSVRTAISTSASPARANWSG
jgi:Ca-activated chloride channel family protein